MPNQVYQRNLEEVWDEIRKKNGTPMIPTFKLDKDEDSHSIDQKLYRCMIGLLLYLTASMPDILFSVCIHARFQANPKESHILTIKKIFRYSKGTSNLRLWYSKDSSLYLIRFFYANYSSYKNDRKNISVTCQFLGLNLISW